MKLFDVRKRDVNGEHLTSRRSRGWLATYLETTRAGSLPILRLTLMRVGCYTRMRKFETIFLQERNRRRDLFMRVRDGHLRELRERESELGPQSGERGAQGA